MECLTKSRNKLVSVLYVLFFRLTAIRSKIKDDFMTFNRESRCDAFLTKKRSDPIQDG